MVETLPPQDTDGSLFTIVDAEMFEIDHTPVEAALETPGHRAQTQAGDDLGYHGASSGRSGAEVFDWSFAAKC